MQSDNADSNSDNDSGSGSDKVYCDHPTSIWCSYCGKGYCNNEGPCSVVKDVGSKQQFARKYPHADKLQPLKKTKKERNHMFSRDDTPADHRAVCLDCLRELKSRRH